ncbi:MAG: carbamoyltransferase HypF, partial [Planctomycetota bacterium]
RALAAELDVEVAPIQHHHAHVAACLAEHGREGPALALVLDGSGHGADGTVWGGELLHADLRSAKRLGRLRPVGLVGGDRAASEPWRSAVAHLVDAGLPVVVPGVEPAKLEAVAELARKRVAAPLASSAGRLFDAVAALTGVRTERGYEGQAAQLLEAAARGEGEPYRFAVTASGEGGLIEVDTRPIIEDVARAARERPAAEVSARFHATLAAALVALVEAAVIEARTVVLAGGCFQNRRLLALVEAGLAARGFAVLYPRSVPAGDGGLSLGQAAIAAARR